MNSATSPASNSSISIREYRPIRGNLRPRFAGAKKLKPSCWASKANWVASSNQSSPARTCRNSWTTSVSLWTGETKRPRPIFRTSRAMSTNGWKNSRSRHSSTSKWKGRSSIWRTSAKCSITPRPSSSRTASSTTRRKARSCRAECSPPSPESSTPRIPSDSKGSYSGSLAATTWSLWRTFRRPSRRGSRRASFSSRSRAATTNTWRTSWRKFAIALGPPPTRLPTKWKSFKLSWLRSLNRWRRLRIWSKWHGRTSRSSWIISLLREIRSGNTTGGAQWSKNSN